MERRTAIVTGGNRGLGFEICRQLAGQGIQTILTARNPHQGREAAERLQGEGLDVLFHPLDITDSQQIQELMAHLSSRLGRLDILINNAGIYLDRHRPALSIAPDLIARAIQTDVCSTFALCQAAIPIMRTHQYGRIVNLSSRTSRMEQMNNAGLTYKISKAALNVITVVLSREVATENILINAVNPGWVKTDMGGKDATRSPKEGAEGPVWLATLPDGGPTGCFFNGRDRQSW
ncbi:MAG: SDR family oxidoreductase [Cyanobacteria bacterium P01_E01_bin.42]